MVHADASNFEAGITKDEAYAQVLEQAKALFEGQRNWVCNLANTASLLHHAYKSLPAPSSSVNWAGFYVIDHSYKPKASFTNTDNTATIPSATHPTSKILHPTSSNSSTTPPPQKRLILAPFIGKVACQTILFTRGVCGTVASTGEPLVIHDVEAWPGHIACDGDSRSEVVVPIFNGKGDGNGGKGEVVGVIDVDCAEVGGFDEVDRVWLERLAGLLGGCCDW